MTDNAVPIACTLSAPDQVARQRELQDELRPAIQEVVELADGFALRFPAEPQWIARLAELITFERACCPFLTLELAAEPRHGPLWLRLRGPGGTKAFLHSTFALCGCRT
ncbi:MAG: hypothetical protein ACRELD_01325 [Longimicrobiales bacterium]